MKIKEQNENKSEHEKNYIIAFWVIGIFAGIILIIVGINAAMNINGKETGIVDGAKFNMSVKEMKKLSGEDFEVFDETDISGCRNYFYNYEFNGKEATLVYVMEKRPFGYRLTQIQINVFEADESDLDKAKSEITEAYNNEKGFKEQEEESGYLVSTENEKAEISLKDGYLSINIEEI